MQRSSFDFDVISGPVEPRPIPKPALKPAPAKPAAEPEDTGRSLEWLRDSRAG